MNSKARTSKSSAKAGKSSAKTKKASSKAGKSSAKITKPSSKSAQADIVGTWRLISAEDYDSKTRKWVPYTFGNPPSGYFFYDATGHASIQIMTTPPQRIAEPDSPTATEALAIFNGYIAYYGTYTLDDVNIYHQVEGAWDPSQVGSVQRRPYQLSGDQLIIGDQVTYKRVLQRVK